MKGVKKSGKKAKEITKSPILTTAIGRAPRSKASQLLADGIAATSVSGHSLGTADGIGQSTVSVPRNLLVADIGTNEGGGEPGRLTATPTAATTTTVTGNNSSASVTTSSVVAAAAAAANTHAVASVSATSTASASVAGAATPLPDSIMDSDDDAYDMDNVDSGNVSSGDDNDDDFGMEVDIPTQQERQAETEEFPYEVLSVDQIVQHQREIIDDVNNVIKLPATMTRILLTHCKWDKEKLLEKYFDGDTDEFFKSAHVVNPFDRVANVSRQNMYNYQPEECEICFSMLPSENMTGLECGHRFCSNCWREYLTTKIVSEGLGQSISCAAHGCDILVDDVTVTTLITDPKVKVKYQQLITNSFVECNQLLRWCPSIDCTYAIKVCHAESRPVRCKCGHVFCFLCGENWHDPVKCRWLKKWIKKCDDDSETSNWIAANTKECPKCNVTIEKDGGCNHMVCKNQNCKHDFCWVCLGSWEPHGSSWYNCNRYDEDEARAARDAQEKLRSSLARYLHYYNRYMNHMASLKFENRLYASVKHKMEEMQQHNMSWIEVQFLKKAVDILCQCRQTLMYTYVFAYYLKKNNQSMIFEDNQKDLESATEKLSEYLERDITSENLADIKQKVQDKYRYCEKRRKVLLDHVHEGYEKDWWDYTE